MPATKLPALFISHGGGPWPFMEDMKQAYAISTKALSQLADTLPQQPRAILSISAHWEETQFTIATAKHPPMIYDYSGFPEHTYHIRYPAPGSPEVAEQVGKLLIHAGIRYQENAQHGFDHGTFVPLSLIYPKADIPVVSLSIKSDYDPKEHMRLGEALQPLRNEGILIIGSGLTYHNLRMFGQTAAAPVSERFEHWLFDAIAVADPNLRKQKLQAWEQAPEARLAHPQEDHLLPLMVTAGAAGDDKGRRLFVDKVWGVTMASYGFGG